MHSTLHIISLQTNISHKIVIIKSTNMLNKLNILLLIFKCETLFSNMLIKTHILPDLYNKCEQEVCNDNAALKIKPVENKLYMEIGDDTDNSMKSNITAFHLLSLASQIAQGMEYLAENRVVHRDLAARNVLVSSPTRVKISDFGMSKDVYESNFYHKKGGGRFPVKWMAIESLTRQLYTTQSDVWSYGVLLWEIVTMGEDPYSGICPKSLIDALKSGYRMPCPKNCSPELYEIMASCWDEKPKNRPTFSELLKKIDKLRESTEPQNYLEI